MADFDSSHKGIFSEEENLLHEIQNQCSSFAEELITLTAKRINRTINTWPVYVISCADDYPSRFTTYDILCCEYQSKTWDEISPLLEKAIDGALSKAYDSLSPEEKFFIKYSECYYNSRALDNNEIYKLIYDRFIELINEHWSESRKIQNFQEKRSW